MMGKVMIKPPSKHCDLNTKSCELTTEEIDRATGGAVQIRELVIKAIVVTAPPASPSPMPVPMPNIATRS